MKAQGIDNLLKLALEASPSGLLAVDFHGTISMVNAALEKQFGYSRAELIGAKVEILLPDALRTLHQSHRSAYVTQPANMTVGADQEFYARRKDGSQFPVEIGLNPVETPDGPMVIASVVDISTRRRLESEHFQAIEKRLQFERLVSEVSARFVNLRSDEVNTAIQDTARRMGEALGLDRVWLLEFSPTDDDSVLMHSWSHAEAPAMPTPVSVKEQFPWTLARLRRGETPRFSSLDEVSDPVEREVLKALGTKSRVSFPLSIGGRIVGGIGFSRMRGAPEWPEDLLASLQMVSQVFANVLARKRADVVLQESEERFHRLADDAPVMIWRTDADAKCTWVNRQWLEFVGQDTAHELGDGWTTNIHPDDGESCLQTFRAASEARRPWEMEYRLRRHDGEWRWVLDRGAPDYTPDRVFQGFLGTCIDITEQKRTKLELEVSLAEGQRLKEQLQRENVYLRRDVQERLGSGPVVGHSPAVRRVLAQVEQVAATDSTVLLLGETGTGKELFATQIHERSARRAHTMVRVNCAAIPAALIESELFGREKGAFTGALARQIGRFELADQSTIFLDEIGDLPQEVQVKLLRVLEEKQIERLGSPRGIRINTRIIAATHRNLEARIADGSFREDLFYRLNVFPIHVPPLRERTEDIQHLVWRFVGEFSKTFGKPIESIDRESMAALQQYPWPGNVRELRNLLERAMIVATGPRLRIVLPASQAAPGKASLKLDDVEREHIRMVLESSAWRIRGAGGAAARLGLKPTTLEYRLDKLGLRRPR
jgi:formate hydrogenlyase transcriptional activator